MNEDVKKNIKTSADKGKNKYESLSEFIRAYCLGKTPDGNGKKGFKKLRMDLDDSKILSLAEEVVKKDKGLKKTIEFEVFLVESHNENANVIKAMEFIATVVSNYQVLDEIKSNNILQTWLGESGRSNSKLGFYERNLKSFTSKSGKKLKPKDVQIVFYISALWLYYKKAVSVDTLKKYLISTTFDIKGERGTAVESAAFVFLMERYLAKDKRKFSCVLHEFNQSEERLLKQLRGETKLNFNLNNKISLMRENEKVLCEKIMENDMAIKELEEARVCLIEENKKQKSIIGGEGERALHANIHHSDTEKSIRIKAAKVLEGKMKSLIDKAVKANSKSKGPLVDYLLKDALEVIRKELVWLNQ